MSHQELLEIYVRGSGRLRDAVASFAESELRERPVTGAWSTLEVLCHLADSEALFAERIKRVLVENRPVLSFADPNLYVAALACHERDPHEELACIESLRKQVARILRAQPAASWLRVGIHSVAGEQTVTDILQKACHHLEHHLGFIQQKRTLLDRHANPDHVS